MSFDSVQYIHISQLHNCGSTELPDTCDHIRALRSTFTHGESGHGVGLMLVPAPLVLVALGVPVYALPSTLYVNIDYPTRHRLETLGDPEE